MATRGTAQWDQSRLPFPTLSRGGVAFAMTIDSERRVTSIAGKHWRSVATSVETSAGAVIERIRELGQRTAAAIDRVIEHHANDTDRRKIGTRLMKRLDDHVARCLERL